MKKLRLVPTILAVLGLLLVGAAKPAYADHNQTSAERNWRLATYGLAGATVYGAATKKPIVAIAGAAGTFLAHQQWKKEINQRHERERNHRGTHYR